MRRRLVLAAAALAGVLASAGCAGQSGEPTAPFEIAGGFPSGVYYGYGEQLALTLTAETDMDVTVIETDGSVENLRRVGAGEAILGFAQGDTAADAISGTGTFEEPLPIQAAARLYDEYVHVVVGADSEIETLADIVGRDVSLGAENSGVNVVATRVMAAAGIGLDEVHDAEIGLDESMAALRAGAIEGFFWVGGLPTPGLNSLAESMPIRLVPVEAEVVEQANAQHAGVYRSAEFPVGVYGNATVTPTMTVPNFLITNADAPEEQVHQALQTLFDSRTRMAQAVPAVALLDLRQAIFTAPIELHPGAVAYYRETRL